MWPRIGPLPTFGVFYSISILSHFLVGYLLAKRLRLRHRVWILAGICYMTGMTIGAKALYDIQHGQFHFRALFSSGHYIQGGLWGGLLAYFFLAVPLVFLLAKHRGLALDLVAMSIPIPWIFVKLACLFNGCCHGSRCSMPWAITFPEGAAGAPADIPLHPTQIYEILIMVSILVVFKVLNYERWRGTMLLWFLALYGLGRAATEFFRGDYDHHLYVGPLTLSQLICLVAAGVSIILLFLWRRFVRNDILD
ncbi:MAG: prolipoprotein diacylglyceryl transferase family protein [Sedimentisphaerales bacterium]|jgi:phosphatidylglycerol:prolipoprotein diacylglycerol transferase